MPEQKRITTIHWNCIVGCPVNSRKLQKDIVSAHLLACLQFQHANFDGP